MDLKIDRDDYFTWLQLMAPIHLLAAFFMWLFNKKSFKNTVRSIINPLLAKAPKRKEVND
jgi:hypothetical protein